MLAPSKTKYRKWRKGRTRGVAYRGNTLAFGEYGLKALECGRLTSKEIEAGRVAINRFIRRKGKLWIRIFPHKPVTKKPAETRMGSGKGSVEYYVAEVQPGRIIYEMEGVDEETAREALRLAAHKLSVATKFIKRTEEIY